MLWKWTLFIVCGILILCCIIRTTWGWIAGKTGPFGFKPADWWGCGIFTIVVVLAMYILARNMFNL